MQEIDELLQAITALEAQRQVLGDRVVEAALTPLQDKLTALEQLEPVSRQRRLVTVFFLDIVNSTRLSQGLEPEEVQQAMGGALKRLSAPIETYGGRITQFLGDGFAAVFGLSRIHENDARQAVRAGLAILAESHACAEELERRYQIIDFKVRIGINTGRVVAGRFSEAESPVMGLTVSLAARMEQAAQPGTLFISKFTHQHVRGAFEFEQLPPVDAKGFPQPIEVYRVLAARPRTFRTFTRGVEGIETRLIGREPELAQLKESLAGVIHNREIQLVTIVGEAGVGKSRLLYEFDRWVASAVSRVIVFKARSSPQMMTVPFGMLREMISYRLGLLTTDPVQVTRQRLVDRLSDFLAGEPEMKAHFVGSLLGFDFSDSPYLKGVENDPRQMRELAQLYLTQCFQTAASQTLTILMLDDLHWADAPSVSFIMHLVNECPQLPLLVVSLGRPPLTERFPDWGKAGPTDDSWLSQAQQPARHVWLDLCPLSRQASGELLDEILRNVEGLPDELCNRILDSADGNPFYLEEYIQSLVDAKVIRKIQGEAAWRLDPERVGSLELPTTLIALLEARLDSLQPAQRVLLQQASVIGRVFWRSALQAIHSERPVSGAELESLYMRGFIIPQETSTFGGTEEYRFHHGLLRNVAYQALLKFDRQTYHGQAAAWLIEATEASGRSGEFAPVIAEHYESAGERDLAADWYTRSGLRAHNQGATAQARIFFDRALSMLPEVIPPFAGAVDLMRRWDALAGRDEALSMLGETEARLADDAALVALAGTIGDDHLLAEAYYRQGYYLYVLGKYPQALEAHTKALVAAMRCADVRREALILGLKVVCESRLGNLQAAHQTSVAALARAEELADDQVLARNLNNLYLYYSEMGDLALATELLNRQLKINRRTGNMVDELVGLANLGYNYVLLGMPEEGIEALRRGSDMAQAIGHRSIQVSIGLNLVLAHLRHDDPAAALEELRQSIPEMRAMNDAFELAVGQTYRALAEEQARNCAGALADFEQAAALLGEIGAIGYRQDAIAGAARCLLCLNHLESAQQHALQLWDYLERHAGAGMELPMLGYVTCADVFSTSGEAALARQVVRAAYHELNKRADKISLPEWRQSFLERVPEHRRIQALWRENIKSEQ